MKKISAGLILTDGSKILLCHSTGNDFYDIPKGEIDFGENPLEQGNDDANAAFENGKAAMRIMGSWFANNVYTDEAAT